MKRTIYVSLIGMICLLCACSAPDKDFNTVESMYGSDEDKGTEMVVEETVRTDDEGKRVVQLGEEFRILSSLLNLMDGFYGISYTIENPRLYDDPKDIGYEGELPDEVMVYDEEAEEKVLDYKIDEVQALVCDITVKNIEEKKETKDININDLDLVEVDPETKTVTWVALMTLFWDHDESRGESEYFHYDLPLGETMKTKAAWFFDKDKVDLDNLYLAYQPTSDAAAFVDLKLSEQGQE